MKEEKMRYVWGICPRLLKIFFFMAVCAQFLAEAQAATTWTPISFANPTTSCPSGYIPVSLYTLPSGTVVPAFCVMQYDAQNGGNGIAASANSGTPLVNVTWQQAAASCNAAGSQLITENQWLSIAHQITSVASNWSGGSVGSGFVYSGHNDNSPANALPAPISPTSDGYTGTGNSSPSNQRRTLTLPNGQIIWDFAGNVWQWVAQTIPIAGRYAGGASAWMAYHSNDGVAAISDALMPLDKQPKNSWNANQGMGRYYDGASTAGAYNTVSEWPDSAGTGYVAPIAAFVRGGGWDDAAHAGVFTLYLNDGRSDASAYIGFRCTR
jgi:formylglycine-generating enzyme required for sulfatase activity